MAAGGRGKWVGGGFPRPSARLSDLLRLMGLALLVAGGLALLGAAPDGHSTASVPRGTFPIVPAASSTQQYTTTVQAVDNSSASSVTGTANGVWIGNTTFARSPNVTVGGGYFSWNGTVDFANHGEVAFEAGLGAGLPAPCQIGTVTANLSVAGQNYTWSTTLNSYGNPDCWVYVAPVFSVTFPSAAKLFLQLTATCYPGHPWAGSGTSRRPVGLNLTGGAGVNVVNATVASAGTVKPVWGWTWTGDPLQPSYFASVTGATIAWSSPDTAKASYNAVVQGPGNSGSYTDVVGVGVISFEGTTADPATLYSFTVTYVVSNIVLPPIFATFNYTITATHVKTSTQYAATYIVPYNLTWSLFEFTVSVPFAGIGYMLMAAPLSWVFESSWPGAGTYTSANNSVHWTAATQAIQVTWLAPNPGGTGLLTLSYLPSSPLFSFFGSTIPFNSVETFVDGNFTPAATFPVVVGTTYHVATLDVFGDQLASLNVTVTSSDQVSLIRIALWPLSVVNLNSSYVIGMTLGAHGVAQTAPDLTPLETQVLYLPAGHYSLTLDFLSFGTGAVSLVVSVILRVVGVGFYVVTGTTLTQIQVAEQNATSLLELVNVTFTNGDKALLNQTVGLRYNVSAVAEALPFRLVAGTPTYSSGEYTVPIFLFNDTGALANASDVKQAWQDLAVQYVTPNGIFPVNWSFIAQGPGQFSIRLALTSQQSSDLENGTTLVSLTSPIKVGTLEDVASGSIGATTIEDVAPPTGWWTTLGIGTPPPYACLCSIGDFFDDAGWLLSSSSGRAIYLLSAVATLLYLWEERTARIAKRDKEEAAERARRKEAGNK